MPFLYRYLLIFIACGALLSGIQVPGFVHQFEQRLDAHFQELQTDLKGYREIADRDFHGSMEALINKHNESGEPAFRDEAKPIEAMYERYRHFNEQRSALQTSLPDQVWYLIQHGDRDLLRETYANYSFEIALDRGAIVCGIVLAAIMLLLVESLAGIFALGGGSRSAHRSTRFSSRF